MQSRAFVFVRTVVVSAAFVSLWTWFFPRWFAMARHVALEPDTSRWWTFIPMAIGAAIMLRCIFDFAWSGRGTPAPFDPPRHLVVAGLYRYVRNPMYVGMGLFLIGEALLLPSITRPMLILTAVLWAAVSVFVIAYEEPALRGTFGDDYVAYTRNVRRWLPRLSAYRAPS
jgi:protein-S-isoprenylcysteine O-methyltransferase Ste14